VPGSGSAGPGLIWLNGTYVPADQARISPLARGFLYGDGAFETMRAERGTTLRLARHLERLHAGLESLRISLEPGAEPPWASLIEELLSRNGLSKRSASVKVVVTRGVVTGLGLPDARRPTVVVTADAYDPPSSERYREGWALHIVSAGAPSAISRQKTLNYLRMLSARQEALDAGADEALLVDGNGLVIETAAASVLALTESGWVAPAHPLQLPSITLRAVQELVEDGGNAVARRAVPLTELKTCRAIWVLNSLIGIMPATAVGKARLPELQARLAEELRGRLFGEEPGPPGI